MSKEFELILLSKHRHQGTRKMIWHHPSKILQRRNLRSWRSWRTRLRTVSKTAARRSPCPPRALSHWGGSMATRTPSTITPTPDTTLSPTARSEEATHRPRSMSLSPWWWTFDPSDERCSLCACSPAAGVATWTAGTVFVLKTHRNQHRWETLLL